MMKNILILSLFISLLFSAPKFTQEEKEWIKANPTVIVGGEVDWAPFDFVKDGVYQGISNDFLELISKKSGLDFYIKTGYTWNELIEGFKQNEFDLLPAVYYSPSREGYGSYSIPYYTVRDYLFVKKESPIKEFEDLNGKILAIPKGYTTINKIKNDFPEIQILETRSIVDSIASVLSDQADATLEVHAVMAYTLRTNAIEDIKVIAQDSLGVNPLHMFIQKDNQILLSILNKSIEDINQEEQNKITNKWITTSFEEFIDSKLAFEIGVMLLIVLGVIAYRQNELRRLNKQLENDQKIINNYLHIVDENVITSTTDSKGVITNVSKAFCEISGFSKEELIGKQHNIVRHEDMPKVLYKNMWETIALGQIWNGEIKNKKKNGKEYWVKTTISPVFNEDQKIINYTAIREDITDKKIIEQISITDGLTDIYNRRHFNKVLPQMINNKKRKNELLCLAIMDIDHFKQYNDTYGHQMGDDVLIKVAQCLKNSLKRSEDICFRLGGEEFGVLFEAKDKNLAFEFTENIRKNIENLQIEHIGNSANKYITVSIGLICEEAKKIKNDDEIFKNGDDLLYEAKRSGRNKVVCNCKI